jgi:DNA-binding transcriptional regulator YiaG
MSLTLQLALFHLQWEQSMRQPQPHGEFILKIVKKEGESDKK